MKPSRWEPGRRAGHANGRGRAGAVLHRDRAAHGRRRRWSSRVPSRRAREAQLRSRPRCLLGQARRDRRRDGRNVYRGRTLSRTAPSCASSESLVMRSADAARGWCRSSRSRGGRTARSASRRRLPAGRPGPLRSARAVATARQDERPGVPRLRMLRQRHDAVDLGDSVPAAQVGMAHRRVTRVRSERRDAEPRTHRVAPRAGSPCPRTSPGCLPPTRCVRPRGSSPSSTARTSSAGSGAAAESPAGRAMTSTEDTE